MKDAKFFYVLYSVLLLQICRPDGTLTELRQSYYQYAVPMGLCR